jgi:Short C-terminal domain/Phospholipase_D-nuclease N-terminal
MLTASAGNDYPLLGLFWTMLLFFGFVIWIWLLFTVIADVFRRGDIGGWGKAGWTALLIVLPMVGVLVYLIAQGGGMDERRRDAADQAREDFETDVRAVVADTGPQPADQIATAKQLLDDGDLTREEFDAVKRRALGLPVADPLEPTR